MDQLTSMERVLLTLKGEETDRVPVCTLAIGVVRQMCGVGFPDFSTNSELAAEAMIFANRLIGDDIFLCFTDLSVEAADFGQKIIYPANSTAHPDYENPLIAEPADYGRLARVNPAVTKRMSTYLDVCSRLVNRVGGECPVLGFVYGPLGVLGMMRGMEKLYMDLLEHPEQVKEGLEIVTDVLVEFVREQYARGVAGVCLDTLPASRSGVRPQMWEEFEGLYAARMAKAVTESGVLLAHHGCGYSPYFKEVNKWINPSVYSFADLAEGCRDFGELKQTYGGQATLMGYVPTDLLYSGTPMEVIGECVREIDQLGKNGRFILAPSCEYPPNTSLQNARAMVTAAQFFDRFKAELTNGGLEAA
ncbi:MAG: uroporphyrinogen decarboxylase family protein [Syntrophobacteraceae bacterium]|nr:uroporphyrinogen decarboxylase family protein [Syntrophobacteraceae bacterium]